MSWQIACLENTLAISRECADEIEKLAAAEEWPVEWEPVEELDDGTLTIRLDYDHAEHMDFIGSDDSARDVLLRHRAEGTVTFGSLEGDNAGSFWGYRFTKGEVFPLTGIVMWSLAPQDAPPVAEDD